MYYYVQEMCTNNKYTYLKIWREAAGYKATITEPSKCFWRSLYTF